MNSYPSAPPLWRTLFKTPEAIPGRDTGTVASSAVVMQGTARPIPNGITTNPGNDLDRRCWRQSNEATNNRQRQRTSPATINGRRLVPLAIHPAKRLEIEQADRKRQKHSGH